VIVQVVDTTYWHDPRQAPGYEPLASVGRQAFSHRDAEGGWRAMARTGRAVATVVLIGGTAAQAAAVSLLRQLVQRM
jgi:hypothetical protein